METPVRRRFLKTAALGVTGASLTPRPGARQPGRTRPIPGWTLFDYINRAMPMDARRA